MSNALSYDELPYPSKFFLQTHPDRLASIATLFGLGPAPVETCRVLELGCGNGSNLISHAFHLPEATFVGVDLAPNHIEDAKRGAAELGLTNTDFRQADVAEMRVGDFGEFDYIIAHGLFSWVPEFVRDRVLGVCREMLSPAGIGYISYNAFPGAHYRRMVQSMLRYRARDVADPIEKVGKAMSFLTFLAENATGGELYRAILQKELERHFEHDAADIFHDDLSDLNRAYYFREFAEMLASNGLRFLGEAELHAMGTGGLTEDAREFVSGIADITEREQYLDLVRGRIFRQTLFCHRELEPDHHPPASAIRKFKLASAIRPVSPNPEIASARVEKFVGTAGTAIQIDHPLTKAVLVELGKSWGSAVAFNELLARAWSEIERRGYRAADRSADASACEAILMQLCRETNLIELHLFQPVTAHSAGERPRVNALARWQLPQARNVLTNLNLDVKIEDAVSRRLLELLDGTREGSRALTELGEFVRSSDEIDDRDELLGRLDGWFAASIAQLERLGMFE
jgi:SAM-dependent methyltransferase